MNKNAKKWVAALRSGRFKQGFGMLNENNEFFCCLGVLCEVAIENGLPLTKGTYPSGAVYYKADIFGNLPNEVMKWAGLRDSLGEYGNEKEFFDRKGLHIDNDRLKLSFSQIADIIESEPPGLFVDSESRSEKDPNQ
jgi:hypothetical protein